LTIEHLFVYQRRDFFVERKANPHPVCFTGLEFDPCFTRHNPDLEELRGAFPLLPVRPSIVRTDCRDLVAGPLLEEMFALRWLRSDG